MSRLKVEFHPDARAELAQAYEWHEERQEGLGLEKLDQVDLQFERARDLPGIGRPVAGGFRALVVQHLPYLPIYDEKLRGNLRDGESKDACRVPRTHTAGCDS